ncbi:MAG: DUF951 domain-containing protein [Bacillota bacterium]|jgi:hypothetical protein
MPMKLFVGDVVQLRKPHPCGGFTWEILRTGIDFRIKCQKCGHTVMLSRIKLEKGIKKVLQSHAPEQ